MKKKLIKIVAAILITAMVIISPPGVYGVSLTVMSIYSGSQYADSLMSEKGIEIDIPSAKGWYPFVMTYNADTGFGRFISEDDRRLTIMYNFPAFDLLKGCSRLYDPASPYYSSFYGAYCTEGSYGFTDYGELDDEKAGLVPQYDYTHLVLRDLGLPLRHQTFRWETTSQVSGLSVAGYDGWSRADVDMSVNGVAHEKTGYRRNYIQYGSPGYDAGEDFETVKMKGVVIGRYFEECDASIYFYIMAPDETVIKAWQEDILKNTLIQIRGK